MSKDQVFMFEPESKDDCLKKGSKVYLLVWVCEFFWFI